MTDLRIRPSTPAERQLAMLWFVAAASALILRPLWITIAPHLRPCTFRGITGIPCPTCGTTRTALALLDFDIGAAVAVNPLATAAGIVFIVGGGMALIWLLLKAPMPAFSLGQPRLWALGLLGLGLINWVYLVLID